jgi:hypothetical protein
MHGIMGAFQIIQNTLTIATKDNNLNKVYNKHLTRIRKRITLNMREEITLLSQARSLL